MEVIGWIVLLISAKRRPTLLKTLSFWAAAVGLLGISQPSKMERAIGIVCLNIVGTGGIGAAYMHAANRFEVPLEPYAVMKNGWKNRSAVRDETISIAWHSTFGVLGIFALWKLWKEK